jgi:hypothetical protein
MVSMVTATRKKINGSITINDWYYSQDDIVTGSLFVWLISHQPAVLFSQNKPAISNQPTVLFSQKKSALAKRTD